MTKIQANLLLNSFYQRARLERAISEYVSRGGRDAYSFSVTHAPKYEEIPGKVIQRMIDEQVEEVDKLKRKGRR